MSRTPDLRITRMPRRVPGRSTSADSTPHSAERTPRPSRTRLVMPELMPATKSERSTTRRAERRIDMRGSCPWPFPSVPVAVYECVMRDCPRTRETSSGRSPAELSGAEIARELAVGEHGEDARQPDPHQAGPARSGTADGAGLRVGGSSHPRRRADLGRHPRIHTSGAAVGDMRGRNPRVGGTEKLSRPRTLLDGRRRRPADGTDPCHPRSPP